MASIVALRSIREDDRRNAGRAGQWRKLALGIIALVVGLGIVWVGLTVGLSEWQLVHRGAQTDGVVTNRYVGDHRGIATSFHVDYQYRDDQGRVLADSCLVHETVFDAIRPGQWAVVRYVPSDPGNACLEIEVARWTGYGTLILGGAIGLAAVGFGAGNVLFALGLGGGRASEPRQEPAGGRSSTGADRIDVASLSSSTATGHSPEPPR